jgi:hypothetical protein
LQQKSRHVRFDGMHGKFPRQREASYLIAGCGCAAKQDMLKVCTACSGGGALN